MHNDIAWLNSERGVLSDSVCAQEVQYKKWLTAYKLGLNDKKVRASGAPPRETALHSLGMHLIDAVPGAAGSAPQPGVDPFLRHDRFRLEAPAQKCVSVLLQTQDTIETREFAQSLPVEELARELRVDQLPGYVLTVNQRLPAEGYTLRSGDLVQVVPLSAVLSRSPPESTPAPAGRRSIPRSLPSPRGSGELSSSLRSSGQGSVPTPTRPNLPPLAPTLSGSRSVRRRSISDTAAAPAPVMA